MGKGNQGGWRKEVRKMGKEKKEEQAECREWSDKENARGERQRPALFASYHNTNLSQAIAIYNTDLSR